MDPPALLRRLRYSRQLYGRQQPDERVPAVKTARAELRADIPREGILYVACTHGVCGGSKLACLPRPLSVPWACSAERVPLAVRLNTQQVHGALQSTSIDNVPICTT